MLGWEIDTEVMTISLPLDKLEQLNDLLERWPAERSTVHESEVRSLIGKLSHVSHIVRPGKFFIHRMLKALRLAPQSGEVGREPNPRSGIE